VKVFIAGATGVLGRALVRQFAEAGHEVVGLARSPEGAELLRRLGGESRAADIFNADALARAAEGSEVVIHAATAIPVKTKTTAKDWEMNDRLRRDGAGALTACAARIGARLYLQQSIVWLARPDDRSFFDEEARPNPDAVTASARDAEEIAFKAAESEGFSTGVLRCGYFYGPDSAHTRMFGQGLIKRQIPIVGPGDAILANIHTEDAASAFVAAAGAQRSGLWHIVDDEGVTVERFLKSFVERLGAPEPRRVPVWLARLVAGSYAASFFTDSTRTSNARFRNDFGWSPRFPSYREGLDQIVESWKASGFIQ
jgi:nucleoside-diphosphate-sugar epimerase